MPSLRLRDLGIAIAIIAVGLAAARDPIGRSVVLGSASLAGSLLSCWFGLRSSHDAWGAAGGASGAGDDLGAILKVMALFLLATLVTGVLAFAAALFFGLALMQGLGVGAAELG